MLSCWKSNMQILQQKYLHITNKKIYVTDKQFKEEDWVCYNWCHLLERADTASLHNRKYAQIFYSAIYSIKNISTNKKIYTTSAVCCLWYQMTFKASEMPTNASYFITSFIGKNVCIGWLDVGWMGIIGSYC